MGAKLKPLTFVAKVIKAESEGREAGLARSLRNHVQGRKGTRSSLDAIAVADGSTFRRRHFLSPLFLFYSFLRKRLSPLSIFECNEQETLKGPSLPFLDYLLPSWRDEGLI